MYIFNMFFSNGSKHYDATSFWIQLWSNLLTASRKKLEDMMGKGYCKHEIVCSICFPCIVPERWKWVFKILKYSKYSFSHLPHMPGLNEVQRKELFTLNEILAVKNTEHQKLPHTLLLILNGKEQCKNILLTKTCL